MAGERKLVLVDQIEPLILTIRGQKVLLDSDLAALYGVPTKRLNEQVRRNRERFPDDFMFQLTAEVDGELEVAKCDLKFDARRAPLPAPCLHRTWRDHGGNGPQLAAGRRGQRVRRSGLRQTARSTLAPAPKPKKPGHKKKGGGE